MNIAKEGIPEGVASTMGWIIKKTLNTYNPGESPSLKEIYLMNIHEVLKNDNSTAIGNLFYYFRDDCVDAMNYTLGANSRPNFCAPPPEG